MKYCYICGRAGTKDHICYSCKSEFWLNKEGNIEGSKMWMGKSKFVLVGETGLMKYWMFTHDNSVWVSYPECSIWRIFSIATLISTLIMDKAPEELVNKLKSIVEGEMK